MHGNVWEWCSDWYAESDAASKTDPTGPATGSGRVLRGGAWMDDSDGCRSATRWERDPHEKSVGGYGIRCGIGFRVLVAAGMD